MLADTHTHYLHVYGMWICLCLRDFGCLPE